MNQASEPQYLSFLHYSSFLVIQVICILLSITLTFHRYLKFVYVQSRGEQFRPYASSDIPVYAPPLLILVFPFSFSSDFMVILLFQHYIHPSADCLRENAIPIISTELSPKKLFKLLSQFKVKSARIRQAKTHLL